VVGRAAVVPHSSRDDVDRRPCSRLRGGEDGEDGGEIDATSAEGSEEYAELSA
jgi:hypothetical protein